MAIVITTPFDNVAFTIALGVLLLSVVLHPMVTACFYRVRADRAWKLIEKGQPVEVTKYSFFSEALGDRGKWDTARFVTLMIAAFHVSTWGLELTLDLAYRTDGPVDLLNRPPPVVSRANVDVLNDTDWLVHKYPDSVPESGTLGSMHGTLEDGNATTAYRIDDEIVKGNTLFASWSPEPARITSGLFYDAVDGQATVEGVSCSIVSTVGEVYLIGDGTRWGRVAECESGPKVLHWTFENRTSPPTIVLNNTRGEVHLIVEEESSYPSFLYSVWTLEDSTTVSSSNNKSASLQHMFYISSTTRLVEAIMTAIVNGHLDGGSSVDLVTQFSLDNRAYQLNGSIRISPFGEHPTSSSVERLDQVEPIVVGVLVSNIGTVSGGLLIAVTASAFMGCLFFRSRRTLDVYNRDELIRAVSLPGGTGEDGKPAALKILVKQEPDKAFSIVISDDGVYRGCDGMRKKLLRVGGNPSTPVSSVSRSISRSSYPPAGSREFTSDCVRPALDEVKRSPHVDDANNESSRSSPAPTRQIRSVRTVELTASPVPSPTTTVQHRCLAPQDRLRRAELNRSSTKTLHLNDESETMPAVNDVETHPRVAQFDVRPAHARVETRSTEAGVRANRNLRLPITAHPKANQATPRVEVGVEASAPKE